MITSPHRSRADVSCAVSIGRAVWHHNGIITGSAGGPPETIHNRSLSYQQLGCSQTSNKVVYISALSTMTHK